MGYWIDNVSISRNPHRTWYKPCIIYGDVLMSERSSIGEKRLEYLDTANKCIAAGDYGAGERHLNNFLTTIRENNPISKTIQERFDELEKEKNESFLKLMQETEKLNAWVQTEERTRGRDYFIAKNITDRINACWNIALGNGLFND